MQKLLNNVNVNVNLSSYVVLMRAMDCRFCFISMHVLQGCYSTCGNSTHIESIVVHISTYFLSLQMTPKLISKSKYISDVSKVFSV